MLPRILSRISPVASKLKERTLFALLASAHICKSTTHESSASNERTCILILLSSNCPMFDRSTLATLTAALMPALLLSQLMPIRMVTSWLRPYFAMALSALVVAATFIEYIAAGTDVAKSSFFHRPRSTLRSLIMPPSLLLSISKSTAKVILKLLQHPSSPTWCSMSISRRLSVIPLMPVSTSSVIRYGFGRRKLSGASTWTFRTPRPLSDTTPTPKIGSLANVISVATSYLPSSSVTSRPKWKAT
mmetsp:Transcript_36692/g.61849  ORF Transcript_36692/g.61849 Transcript_36692/m.61849 type:complete len:246 (-) Transcript_36692:2812-3549(-)